MLPMEGPPTDGNPNYASELKDRVESCLIALRTVDGAQMIEDTIELARELYALTTENSDDRFAATLLLAASLRACFQRYGDDGLLDEIIHLGRQALILSPESHPHRDVSCGNLASSLKTRYQSTGDVGLLDEVIDLEREALDLCPAGHPRYSIPCGNLAISLKMNYEHTGDVDLLDEAIDLEREALDLRPTGHPYRSVSFVNLATSLMARYKRTGDAGLLDEAIDLQREALDLHPAGHPNRASSCGNLAIALKTCYGHTGDAGLMDEAVELEREALDLRPTGHPDHSMSCGNLANSLMTQYKRTGDAGLIDEAIGLQREALDLHPAGHPSRASSCANLATLLATRYERTDDTVLLDEAIDLEREALDLCPAGNSIRALSCGNLAMLLEKRYRLTGDVGLLDEAIDLEREALDLRPIGHSDRFMSCGNLASLLTARHGHTDDVVLIREILTILQEAVTIAPVHVVWRNFRWLVWILLQSASPFYDVHQAIMYLSQSLQHAPDDTLAFVLSLSSLLDILWQCNAEGKHTQLTTIYQRLVNLLPLLIHPAAGLQLQLQALKRCTQLGSDAFVNAALADDWSIGLETLELAQGVIWSTTLHRRDPQLTDVPEHLASKLQDLLPSFALSSAAQPDHTEWKPFISPRDILYTQSSRFYAVLREIRALPGLERFMLGETIDALRTVASNHPVVILASARGHHYALIMDPSTTKHALLSLDLTFEEERELSSTKDSLRQSRGGMADEMSVERALKISTPSRANTLEHKFEILWEKVVSPVIEQLELKVSDRNHFTL
jgi:tetratricopeptide (TPR) repeat protein